MKQHAMTLKCRVIPSGIWADLKKMQGMGAILDIQKHKEDHRILLSVPENVRISEEQINCLAAYCAVVK